ncbi:MAG: ABC transporter substrate-binding protein [Betaproteobacteria bacterium]|nr:ABC transporter substrate-binding protein [Betaproteobacteria bacterium]
MLAMHRTFAGLLALAGCVTFGTASEALAQKKIIRSVPIGALKIVDPIWTTAYITRNHSYMVWDTLFSLDAKNEPQPQMVDAWKISPDKLTYSFTLRSGLLWHDNTPVRAADCVASIRRWGAKDGMGRALMGFTDKIEAIDDKSFRLVLKQPVGFVLEALGKIDSNVPFMMPERIAKTDPNTQITEVIGSGPFRFLKEEFVPGVKVVYEKFTGYVPRKEPASLAAGGKVVKIDRVESVYMPDAAVAIAALGNGEVDLLESPANDLIRTVQNNPNVFVRPNDPLGYQLFMAVNHLYPPFDRKEARQALLWGIKQAEFLEVVIGDAKRYQECVAVYGCGTPNESKLGSEALASFNLEKSKALLKSAGYGAQPIVLLDPTDNAVLHPAALVATQTLKRMGMNVDTQAMDFSTLTQRRASKNLPSQGGWNVFVTNATMTGIANPVLHTYSMNCEQAWYGWPCDKRIVDLSRQWALELDAAKRKQIIGELQRVHMENVTYIPLGQYRSVIAYRKNVKGMIASPSLFYWNIEKE